MTPEELIYTLDRARIRHELQLQQAVRISANGKTLGFALAAEFVDEAEWKTLAKHHAVLLLSSARAGILDATPTAGVIAFDAKDLSLEAVHQLMAGPRGIDATSTTPPIFAASLVALAKQAGIIPAILWVGPTAYFTRSYEVDAQLFSHQPPVELLKGETVRLPIEGAEDATLTSFRSRFGSDVHLALTIGNPNTNVAPLVRVHSSCVTGDLLGSLRCDCGSQLKLALSHMKDSPFGILLYLYQEGRGIGITSKLRAYALQEQGLDTFTANQQLGFEEDERDFSIAAEILHAMGHENIRLLTNNPDKIEAFVESDIRVTERLPLVIDPTSHNHAYLEAKKAKRGHL